MPTPANGNASEKFPLPTTAVPPPLLLLVTPCAPISDLSLLAFPFTIVTLSTRGSEIDELPADDVHPANRRAEETANSIVEWRHLVLRSSSNPKKSSRERALDPFGSGSRAGGQAEGYQRLALASAQ